jgi:hypothetical protein
MANFGSPGGLETTSGRVRKANRKFRTFQILRASDGKVDSVTLVRLPPVEETALGGGLEEPAEPSREDVFEYF